MLNAYGSRRVGNDVTGIVVLGLAVVLSVATVVRAEDDRLVLNRGNGTIVLEPYGPNIIRVTLSDGSSLWQLEFR